MKQTIIFLDKHSKECMKVSRTVSKIDNSQWFDQINFKLEKILQSMESISHNIRGLIYFFIIYSK